MEGLLIHYENEACREYFADYHQCERVVKKSEKGNCQEDDESKKKNNMGLLAAKARVKEEAATVKRILLMVQKELDERCLRDAVSAKNGAKRARVRIRRYEEKIELLEEEKQNMLNELAQNALEEKQQEAATFQYDLNYAKARAADIEKRTRREKWLEKLRGKKMKARIQKGLDKIEQESKSCFGKTITVEMEAKRQVSSQIPWY
eukprot:g1660.t1